MTTPTSSSTRAVRLALLAVALVVGWLFILWQNRFYLTPAVVFVMLGYFAVVMTIYNLWRTGAAAVAPNDEDDGDAAWGLPAGERDDLDKEKRTLLKAIKEAEFDHAMGKLSKRDVDEMIATYRARAIDVIKEDSSGSMPARPARSASGSSASSRRGSSSTARRTRR